MTLAHGGRPHTPHDLWREWGLEPVVLVSLAISAALYGSGLYRFWRGDNAGRGIARWEAWCYAGGWFALFIALVSPLHPWGRVLFSAHMTQHEVLMLVAAPLLILGRPLLVFLKALPAAWSRPLGRLGAASWWRKAWHVISNALVAWCIHAAALWLWHVPALFQATLDHEWVHAAQHASFLFSALLFWYAVMQGRGHAIGYGAAVLYMFTTALHSGLLGALITFTHTLWYPAYAQSTESWGLTPLEDQQLGGLIMWIPAGAVYIIAGLALMAGWFRESDRRVRKWEATLGAATAGGAGEPT